MANRLASGPKCCGWGRPWTSGVSTPHRRIRVRGSRRFRSGASMSMKNWYGLLGGRRNKLHQDIHNAIKELSLLLTPTLVILDGTTAMMHNGPTGGSLSDLKDTNTMIVSTDQVAADAFGATLLGRTVTDLPYISKAAKAGSGTADWASLNPIRGEAKEPRAPEGQE